MDTDQIQRFSSGELPGSTTHPPQQNGQGPRTIRGEELGNEYAGMDVVSGPDDVDYDRNAPKLVSAAMLNKFVEENPNHYPTFRMILHQTTINLWEQTGGQTQYAEVRLVNLTDRALIGSLPTEVRKLVERLFFAGSANQRGNRKAENRMKEGLDRLREIGHAYGVAGFVQPRLVLHKDHVQDPENEVWVGAIALHDLTEFSRICEGDDQLAARRLEGFSLE